ncbi:IS3 family transposase, partial [Klebsiella pneumoniae]
KACVLPENPASYRVVRTKSYLFNKATLKVECIHVEDFVSREIMRTAVFNYIECDYNRWRRHSACGGLSPEQFENQNLA